jgi:RimJ/RimL family protein N-acetyltransferase
MKVTFTEMDYTNDELFKKIEKWHNSHEVRKNYLLNFSEEDTKREINWENIQERFSKDELERFIILVDGIEVGEFNYHLRHPLQKFENSLWIGISIGEESFKGKGVAKEIMLQLERIALEMDKPIMEIGVYDFNKRALKFYEKMGYKEFDRDEDFAYWGGKKWPFIRMKKDLRH